MGTFKDSFKGSTPSQINLLQIIGKYNHIQGNPRNIKPLPELWLSLRFWMPRCLADVYLQEKLAFKLDMTR